MNPDQVHLLLRRVESTGSVIRTSSQYGHNPHKNNFSITTYYSTDTFVLFTDKTVSHFGVGKIEGG